MAKKMPLIISTLTLLAGSFTPTATWADDFSHLIDGPWSFDEMMAAEAEVQPIINEVCPYEYDVTECVYRYTEYRYDDDPIYNRLLLFENNQFHILSMNPESKKGKTTIEYYFNPENSYEKYSSTIRVDKDYLGNIIRKRFDGYSYIHTISKLYIYQVEDGNIAMSLDKNRNKEILADSHTKILYSGVKDEDADSLLPVSQKGTLEVDEVSFEPQYLNRLYVIYEDERGNMHPQGISFVDCHQGGDYCRMQYTKKAAEASLVNKPTYEQGFTDGYNTGYDDGYSDGADAGYNDGYSIGYDATIQNQNNNANEEDSTSQDSEIDGTNSTTDNTNNNEQITDNEISVQNTNSISLNSNSLINSEAHSWAKAPDTGASTSQESHSTEFPWWLSIIFVLGTVALIWLFAPKRKKSSKNPKKTIDIVS